VEHTALGQGPGLGTGAAGARGAVWPMGRPAIVVRPDPLPGTKRQPVRHRQFASPPQMALGDDDDLYASRLRLLVKRVGQLGVPYGYHMRNVLIEIGTVAH
jgi:hypothetical protein